ncbi:MAG: alpha-ketoglutarate-dependent dioxygenase AlkB [Hyphomicrobiales bacterium]
MASDGAAAPYPEGLRLIPGRLDRNACESILAEIVEVIVEAPLYRPVMPKSGRPFSVEMTNCGSLGWMSDRDGYRYSARHPVTGRPWPRIPASILSLWRELTDYPAEPEACLVNYYEPGARMGLHRDEDEADFTAPILSISLGDTAKFRIGGPERKGPTRSFPLASGDVLLLGGASRCFYHGIDRLLPGTSTLLSQCPPNFPQRGANQSKARRVRPNF